MSETNTIGNGNLERRADRYSHWEFQSFGFIISCDCVEGSLRPEKIPVTSEALQLHAVEMHGICNQCVCFFAALIHLIKVFQSENSRRKHWMSTAVLAIIVITISCQVFHVKTERCCGQ